jgi:hypothetical protein
LPRTREPTATHVQPSRRQGIGSPSGANPGILLAYNFGILINLAAAVHHGVGYQFGFRDPTVKAATDPADQAAFLAILESMQSEVRRLGSAKFGSPVF